VTTTAAVSQPSALTGSDAMIEVEGVSKAFGPVQALVGVSLHVQAGRVLGLLGPNGAGKSTLVRILTTLLRPDSGHGRVAGFDIVRDDPALPAASVGPYAQQRGFPAAGGRRDDRHLVAGRAVQRGDQVVTVDQGLPAASPRTLRRGRHVGHRTVSPGTRSA
jgi:ABC-type branched-subunit amino acid transport system ATPase component